MDPGGDVVLSELRHGAPVAIGRCRVEVGEGPAPATARTEADPGESRPWRGDVEPIGFPFPIGATEPIDDRLFDFDDAGGWILLADRFGMFRAWRADGSGAEMLPRATVEGRVLGEVEAVVGVAGGFVVAGHAGDSCVAAHYDFAGRTCTAHVLGLPRVPMTWSYVREFHSVVARHDGVTFLAIDLGAARDRAIYPRPGRPLAPRGTTRTTGRRTILPSCSSSPKATRSRCTAAPSASARGAGRSASGRSRRNGSSSPPSPTAGRSSRAGRSSGPAGTGMSWRSSSASPTAGGRLHAFSASDSWRSLGEFTLARDVRDFALSRDGRRLAWRVGGRQLEVRDVESAGPSPLVTPKGRVHDRLDVEFGRKFLAVQAGRHAHLVRWDRGPLEFARTEGPVGRLVAREFERSERALARLVARGSEILTPRIMAGDNWRIGLLR